MSSDPFKEFEALADRLEKSFSGEVSDDAAKVGRSFSVKRFALRLWQMAAALVLPFLVLVGGSVFFYKHYGVPTWPALLGGVLLTTLILLGYGVWLTKKLTGRRSVSRKVAKVALAVVCAYSLYSLVYLSSLNVKDDGIRNYYRSLHPLLRVAVSTFILVDPDLVVTDMKRAPHDYVKMGLPVSVNSMHYPQDDGYVHAVDLRTIGRGTIRNWTVEAYFRLMGFRTLRHVGTADHLHVSLPFPF